MRRWVALALASMLVSRSGGVRYQLGGFNCPSETLSSPVVIKDGGGQIDKFCKDFQVQLEDRGKEGEGGGQDDATSLCLEASHSPLPGQKEAQELLCVSLPVEDLEKQFNSKIRSLATLCPECRDRCGTYYLVASLKDASGKALWFDSLTLRQECSDSPALSLSVQIRSSGVNDGLRQGSQNPFDIIGIEKVTVGNEVKNCTQEKSSSGGCGEQTELSSRWAADLPEVVAFFIPLTAQDLVSINQSGLGLKDFTGKSWLLNKPQEMKKLIKLGSENLNMFEKPIFLHDDNIMKLREAKEATLESVGVGQEVGEVDLAKTKFPIGVGYGGLLIIALDPLWKINDLDRTDNVFVQYVAVNGTDENGDWVENPLCSADGVGLGRDAYIYQNDFYGEARRLRYSGERKGLRRGNGKKANVATVIGQLARMRATKLEKECGLLDSMMDRFMSTNQPFLGKVSNLLDLISINFEGNNFEARDEADIVAKVLRVLTGLVQTFADDEQLQGLALKIARKEMAEKHDGGGPHWEGSGGSGHWEHPSEGGGSWGEPPAGEEGWGEGSWQGHPGKHHKENGESGSGSDSAPAGQFDRIIEGDFQLSSGPTNDWHYVSIRRVRGSQDYTWENKAGATWDLTLVGEENHGSLRFKVGENCPYYRDGYTTAYLYFSSTDGVEIEGPWKEMYKKTGGEASLGGWPETNSTDWHGSDYGSWAGSDYEDFGSGSDFGSDNGHWSGSDYGDYGSGHGSDYGEWGSYDDYGSGADYGNYGSDYGGWGDYDDYDSGSYYGDYGSDFGDYGSDYDGWGDYESGSSYGDYGSDYNSWGSGSGDWRDYETTDYWGDYGNTSPHPDQLPSPSMEELNEMDVQEVIWAFQTMDAHHLKNLMETNEQDVNNLLDRMSVDEKLSMMESIKSYLSGEDVCERKISKQRSNRTLCMSIGCCQFDDTSRQCWSDVGDGPCSGGPQRPGSGYWPSSTGRPGSGTRPKPTGSGSGSESGRRPPKLPSLQPDMPTKELTNALDEMDDDTLETFINEMDSDTQWEMYEKLNGTAYANILADYVYEDSYDESESMWDNVFGDFKKRKKRQARMKRSMVDDVLEDMGDMGDIKDLTEDMEMGERVNFMAAMGLQGVMIMNMGKIGRGNRMPKIVRELPGCAKQILWAPDKTPRGFLCSKLSKDLRVRIRELMMVVLRKEIPTTVFEMDWEEYGQFIGKSGIDKDLLKIAMTKAAAPIGVEDLRELMGPIKRLFTQLLDKEDDTSKKNVLKVIGGLIDAIDKEDVYEQLADIIREIQGLVIFKKPMPMMTGVPGPPPTEKSLCLSYSAHSVAEENGRREARKALEPPTVWLTKASTVYKAEFCQLTNRWFWTSVAKCSCTRDSCPRKPKRAHTGEGGGWKEGGKGQWGQEDVQEWGQQQGKGKGKGGKGGKGSGRGTSSSKPSY